MVVPDITLSTNFTGTGSNEVHRYYPGIPAGTWEVYVCHDESICMDNPATIGRAVITDSIPYCTTYTSSGSMLVIHML